MPGSGDELAPGTAGRLRASHADRNRVIDVLKAAFTQGMLDKDEFDLRVGQVLTSRTYAELAGLTADIPATLAAAQPPPVPNRQSRERRFVKALACALVVVPTTMVGMVLIAGHHLAPAAIILNVVLFACMVGVPATLLVVVHSWLDNRASRSTRPGSLPSAPGTASWRLASAHPEGQPKPISHDPPGTAQAAGRPRPAPVQPAATASAQPPRTPLRDRLARRRDWLGAGQDDAVHYAAHWCDRWCPGCEPELLRVR